MASEKAPVSTAELSERAEELVRGVHDTGDREPARRAVPTTHGRNRVPRMLFGGGKTFRMGRHLTFDNASHNDLLVSIQNAFGIESPQFGEPKFTTGPLTGLV